MCALLRVPVDSALVLNRPAIRRPSDRGSEYRQTFQYNGGNVSQISVAVVREPVRASGMVTPRQKPSKGGNLPLERSSYEFMVALVVASVTQLIPNWEANLTMWIVLAGIAIYFCWYSRGTAEYGNWRKFFLSLCSIIFISSIAYEQVLTRYREANIIPPPVLYMTAWGATEGSPILRVNGTPPRVISGIPNTSVTVDGRLLEKYKRRFNLMAVALHVINSESYMDKKGLCKSKIVKIRPEDIYIKIDYSEQFLEEIQLGAVATSYVLLATPQGMTPESFDTLNDAEDKGAQIIGSGGAGGHVIMPPK
jgi:hypothetical protein